MDDQLLHSVETSLAAGVLGVVSMARTRVHPSTSASVTLPRAIAVEHQMHADATQGSAAHAGGQSANVDRDGAGHKILQIEIAS